jgi:hypothetical protein
VFDPQASIGASSDGLRGALDYRARVNFENHPAPRRLLFVFVLGEIA